MAAVYLVLVTLQFVPPAAILCVLHIGLQCLQVLRLVGCFCMPQPSFPAWKG
jgi:hypothetical protein